MNKESFGKTTFDPMPITLGIGSGLPAGAASILFGAAASMLLRPLPSEVYHRRPRKIKVSPATLAKRRKQKLQRQARKITRQSR
jgi:hypothetical protein